MMKTTTRNQPPRGASRQLRESLERTFAHRVTRMMGGDDPSLVVHVERRLSAARWQAVEAASRARRAKASASVAVLAPSGGPGGPGAWWIRLASFVPALALTLGLIGIDRLNISQRIEAAAEVDAALLADDLPPTAYADPGFAEFIRQPQKTATP